MNRRTALVALLLAPMAEASAGEVLPGTKPGELTLDLGRWAGVTVRMPGRPDIRVTAKEVYEALRDA